MEIKVRKLITGGRTLENQQIHAQNGVIVSVSEYEGADFDYECVAPALVDIHINGGERFHFTANPTAEALRDIETSARKNGVGYVLPALITSSVENIFEAIAVTQHYIRSNPGTGILGLHLEGPFISKEKRGAHLSKYVRTPSSELLQEIIQRADGTVKMMTIAPEHFTDRQIGMLLESGIKVSLGHSNCTYERAVEAFNLGVDLVTHLFNAMSPFHHRNPGLTGAALATEKVYTPIIADGVHVDYAMVKLALTLKKDKLFFISDALFQNHIKRDFRWEEFDATLVDGEYINADGNLAGATISMADCVRNGVERLGLSLEQALEKSTEIPAAVLGLKAGKIEAGYPAKFCCFDGNLTNFNFF